MALDPKRRVMFVSLLRWQVFLTVYLSNDEQHFTEVPVTPQTLCRDVVELCKETGEADCYLAEMWRGSGKFWQPSPPWWRVEGKDRFGQRRFWT